MHPQFKHYSFRLGVRNIILSRLIIVVAVVLSSSREVCCFLGYWRRWLNIRDS
jgi:hypothetical protein